jgi:tetratricopeptide (TPR) repeat protein
VGFTQTASGGGAQDGSNPAAPAVAPGAAAANPSLAKGLAALHDNEARTALTDFQQVLQSDPNNTAANLLASTAAVELFQGPAAVQYAEKARQLDPQNWKIHTTLVAAYSAAGMKQQRDQERALLHEMHRTGAPDARLATGFLLEMFPVENYRVDAVEYFEPMGKFRTWYRFLVRQADGHRVGEIDVQSDDFDQKSWAEAHPTEAAAGQRQFQITGHGDDSNSVDYRMFSGMPDYDNIRVMVVEILHTRGIPGSRPLNGKTSGL